MLDNLLILQNILLSYDKLEKDSKLVQGLHILITHQKGRIGYIVGNLSLALFYRLYNDMHFSHL
jgi:hypothetical protein